jgi:hypothetical protein
MAGLSRAKTSYVTDIAKMFADADIMIGQRGGGQSGLVGPYQHDVITSEHSVNKNCLGFP